MEELQPIDFQTALAALGSQAVTIPTLGKQSKIIVQGIIDTQIIQITTGSGKVGQINEEHWNLVMTHLESLPMEERCMTSRYGEDHWPERPHRIYTPYVPAIVRYLTINC